MGSTGPANPTAEEVLQEIAKQGTNVDTLVGRLVIDQGFATPDEVQHCLALSKSLAEDRNQRSLAELLVDNEYVTKRQMTRLREVVQAERSGQKIPGYKVIDKLGAGAMATVFKAKQLSLDRLVAIKVLPRKFSSNPQFIERFYAEGRAAAQLNHPNIVQAYDVGKAGDYHYFVMEYVEGQTVFDQIVKSRRYSEPEAIDIAIQIAEALLHAHDKGIVHRDVKPKNVMLTKAGSAKLADMGLARAISDKEAAEAEQGKAFGTPYYISPEQIRGEIHIGPQADIYSLGATLYHMVCGAVPFDGKNPSAVMHKHLKSDLIPPDHVNPKLSAGISEVIELMMAKDARKRYQNCRDLLGDLRAIKAKQPPPIAHKDFAEADLASLAKAEAAVATEIPVSTAAQPPVRKILVVALGIALAISMIGNIILIVMKTTAE
ncbi:MAG: serine/threonine-protein kinase [bacterium]|nr:serine/threonine-protein kinase [bacterium]